MKKTDLQALLGTCVHQLDLSRLPAGAGLYRGKVRDVVDVGAELLIATTDRISAFDRVLSTIPCKGELLNTVSQFWFRQLSDIVRPHIIEEVSPRTVRARKCAVVPVEVVVRGYLTGSAWRDYQKTGVVSGIRLPEGMRQCQRFETPLLTPSTKEASGQHDMPVSRQEIISGGLVEKSLWEQIEQSALALFRKGSEIAARNGLILVDTKYEFGTNRTELFLVDEVHTPDSSRYWYADTYEELFQKGQPQRELDKEYLRQWLLAKGWKGEGAPPAIPDDVRIEVAWKYITAWQTITGREFCPRASGLKAESDRIIALATTLLGSRPEVSGSP